MPTRLPLAALFLAGSIGLILAHAGDEPVSDQDDFVPMFNGKDLSGWVNVNTSPGTFYVQNGEIVTTGTPTGFLRTDRHYENFILEMEWLHENVEEMGNSGLFVWGDPLPAVGTGYTRGIEVQILVNYETDWATSHGDIFSIWGAKCVPDRPHPKGYARCLPSERRAKGGGEWNHYKVIANDGSIKLHVNGKEVSGVSQSVPRKGYLALESEGAFTRFRNIKIKELPSTDPKPEEIADLDQGHYSVFDGLSLAGWSTSPKGWTPASGVLKANGDAKLVSDKRFGPIELIFDWKQGPKAQGNGQVKVGDKAVTLELPDGAKPGSWNRVTLQADGGPIEFTPAQQLELRSLFVRELDSK